MAAFVENIWESIFTAGPTPTLVLATNISFAALQLVFAGLLFATYSIHFVVLSVISAGLWWSINWFAREVMAVQAEAAAAAQEANGETQAQSPSIHASHVDDQSAMDSGDDTDGTELDGSRVLPDRHAADASGPAALSVGATPGEGHSFNTTTAARLVPDSNLRARRRGGPTDSPGDLSSTDSEWEQVDP